MLPSLSLLAAERPTPSDIIKGTVIGPVVTPPASNATAIKSEGVKKDKTKTNMYRIPRSKDSLTLNKIRKSAITIKIPTPTATVRISTILGIADTWFASTCRSGSEIVMIPPIIKHTTAISTILLLLTSLPPTPCPSGVIAISAPSWKSPIPIINKIAPVRNNTKVLISSGTNVILRINTIIVIGRTLERDSFVFSFSFSFIRLHILPSLKHLLQLSKSEFTNLLSNILY